MLWHPLTSQEVIGETVRVHHPRCSGSLGAFAACSSQQCRRGRLVAYGAE
jgi:hypothetical protein